MAVAEAAWFIRCTIRGMHDWEKGVGGQEMGLNFSMGRIFSY